MSPLIGFSKSDPDDAGLLLLHVFERGMEVKRVKIHIAPEGGGIAMNLLH